MEARQIAPEVGDTIQMEVESLNYSAHAVARTNGLVVFVAGGVPGDGLLARITQIKKNYAVAEAVDVLSASRYRCQPPCAHFIEGCGGCQWQHITYEYQLYWKKEILKQALKRIGKLDDIPEVETRGMYPPLHYRSKLRLFPAEDQATGAGIPLGMRRASSHEVVPIRNCLISTPIVNSLSSMFHGEIFSPGSEFNEINIRSSDKYQQVMLTCTYYRDSPKIADDINKLSRIPEVASIFYRISSESGYPGKSVLGYGSSVIREKIRGIEYKIGSDCFFQVNISNLRDLADLVREFAGRNNRFILDAHCGVGTFALQMADVSDVVWGTDISSQAVALAQSNALDNSITNAHFRNARAADVLGKELRDVTIDLVILDPPRKGCEKADLQALIHHQPSRVIYVSCNPTTLARDLHDLGNAGYRLLRLVMVDMFPMTYHLEVVALCARRSNDG
jgi:23S rRNA (uracil1939-C5)-methyltransferase